MAMAREKIKGLINDLSEEKLGRILSYINFIKDEEEPILVLEEDDEAEIAKILEENKWYTSEEVKGAIEDFYTLFLAPAKFNVVICAFPCMA